MKEKTWLPGNISDRVRDLREEWGLTRKELAQRSGVDESLLGRIENNKIWKIQDDALTTSKVRFDKKAQYRADKPDYADRAVAEALVNALIHRDYIVRGSEIHIELYNDRLEIQSPGGMFEGKPIRDCNISTVGSVRRNPVIADLFHRMENLEQEVCRAQLVIDKVS